MSVSHCDFLCPVKCKFTHWCTVPTHSASTIYILHYSPYRCRLSKVLNMTAARGVFLLTLISGEWSQCPSEEEEEKTSLDSFLAPRHLNSVSVSAVQGQSLTSSGPVVSRAGESVTLSCKVQGLALAWLHWIRQRPGKGLEWIGRIDSGTGTIFAQSLQGQFSITKDTSTNHVFLKVTSLKQEDSAVYYCARESQWHTRPHSCTKTEQHCTRSTEACQLDGDI